MAIYEEMAAAMKADDVGRYVGLLHDDFQYIRHKSKDALSRDEMGALLGKVWSGGNRVIEDMRCIYENDEILVMHTTLRFKSGSREAALISHLKKDGKVVRIESGVSDLT